MSTAKRKSNRMSVFVVEDHNCVVSCIYRKIGSKLLSFNNLALLHLDAHSDMSSPKLLSALDVHNVEAVYDSINIESWIVPMMYSGHVNSMVWIKPPWTQDSMSENSGFLVGRDTESNEICVSSTDNYFLSELSYCPEERLADTHTVSMLVRTLSSSLDLPQEREELESAKRLRTSLGADDCRETRELSVKSSDEIIDRLSCDLNQVIGSAAADAGRDYILDIDLDFFSTEDPFISSLSAEQYSCMKELYRFSAPDPDNSSPESIEECMRIRKEQIKELKSAVQCVQLGQPHKEFSDEKRNELFKKFIAGSKLSTERTVAVKDSKQSASVQRNCSGSCDTRSVSNNCANDVVCITSESNRSEDRLQNLPLNRDIKGQSNDIEQVSCSYSLSTVIHSELDESVEKLAGPSSKELEDATNVRLCRDSFSQAVSPLIGECGLDLRKHVNIPALSETSTNGITLSNTEDQLGLNNDTDVKQCCISTNFTVTEKNVTIQTDRHTHEGQTDGEVVDLDWLHEIGTGIDDFPLPHHKSDWATIENLIRAVRALLQRLSHPPALITIARSSEDGYCPADQVDRIQEMVLEMLESLYGPLDVSLRYLDD